MNYQEMSDFEINCRVHFQKYRDLKYEKGRFYYSSSSGREMVIGKYLYKLKHPDYCSSWADAGPIIQENGISICHHSGNWEAEIEVSAPIGAFGTDEICVKFTNHKNPLRAAMIVFLMMKGGE